MSRHPRGQTLVLFSLTMLLLVLMVTLTLSIGMKVKENHELQHIADAAAYSNAVATARVYNNISLLNRIQVSYWVAQAADQSLISWTTMARAYGGAAQNAYSTIAAINSIPCAANPIANACYCATAAAAVSLTSQLNNNLNTKLLGGNDSDWEKMDMNAGKESQAIQGIIAGLRGESQDLARDLNSKLDSSHYVKQVILAARPGMPASNELDFVSHSISSREAGGNIGGPLAPAGEYGAVKNPEWNKHMLDAAMGSRLNSFVTGRSMPPPFTFSKVFSGLSGGNVIPFDHGGSGYWGDGFEQFGTSHAKEAWGDDHGQVMARVTAPGCGLRMMVWRATAHVKSTEIEDDSDEHKWTAWFGGGDEPGTPSREDHTMGSCAPLCPSVWVRAVSFSPTNPANDAYGQPKNFAVVSRDYSKRAPEPWHLDFKFKFSSGGGERFNSAGLKLSPGNGGLDISKAAAISTGMTYYHRKGHWREFPNFLNPYWRATLVASDIDARHAVARDDVANSVVGWQSDVYQALTAVDFKGMH